MQLETDRKLEKRVRGWNLDAEIVSIFRLNKFAQVIREGHLINIKAIIRTREYERNEQETPD